MKWYHFILLALLGVILGQIVRARHEHTADCSHAVEAPVECEHDHGPGHTPHSPTDHGHPDFDHNHEGHNH